LGYVNNEKLSKEFFAVMSDFFSTFQIRNHNDLDKIPYPKNYEPLAEKSQLLYKLLDKVARTCLSSLAIALEIKPSIFLDLLDQQSPESKDYNPSMLHLFHYYGKTFDASTIACVEHTDSGFITGIIIFSNQYSFSNSKSFKSRIRSSRLENGKGNQF
jgi:isopenicillin N synthase-like dioxygenase